MTENVEKKQPLSLCRLCLSYTTRPIPLTTYSKASVMLEALTTIRVLSTDTISTVSCLKCFLNLKLAFSIQQNFLTAEQRFRDRLSSFAVKVESQDDEERENVEIDPLTSAEVEQDIKNIRIKEEIDTASLEVKDTESKEATSSHVCDICGKDKGTKDLLRKHKYNMHKPTKCPVCSIVVTESLLRTHIKQHNNPNKNKITAVNGLFVCDICGKEKKTKTSLRKHKYSVHQFETCPVCNKQIKKTNIRTHIELHKGKTFICDICGATVKNLRAHILYKHKNSGLKCKFCDKIFQHQNSRASHELRDHDGDQKFICDVCGKKFYFAKDLKTHVEGVHLKQRAFPCKICNVNYSSKLSLRTHMRKHTNETPYKCENCGDGFKHKVSLKSHLKSKHQIEEELTCECRECGKMFASRAALIAHGRIH